MEFKSGLWSGHSKTVRGSQRQRLFALDHCHTERLTATLVSHLMHSGAGYHGSNLIMTNGQQLSTQEVEIC